MIQFDFDRQALTLDLQQQAAAITGYHFQAAGALPAQTYAIDLALPMAGIAYQWTPGEQFDHSILPNWRQGEQVAVNHLAPIRCFYGIDGQNVLTIACDLIDQRMTIKAGVREEDAMLHVTFTFSAAQVQKGLTLRVDTSACSYAQALFGVSLWWEKQFSVFPAQDDQRLPLFSTWYAFHQNVSAAKILAQVPKLQQLGIQTVILDDGWQTDDNQRGYAYTGDWQVSKKKFPDFKAFVAQMHQAGIKVVVWFSVPYVGMKSKKWQELASRMLYLNERSQCGILDLRYQSNIDFLAETYRQFVQTYQVDGLKLDFIDTFNANAQTPRFDAAKMQYADPDRGLQVLLKRVRQEMLAVNPHFFIEFRQSYIGPQMRAYGNAFRVSDCPYAAITNHVGICNLRLLSGSTPVHSDMIMWHPEETAENTAIQLQAALFGVPQLSIDLTKLTAAQFEVLAYYCEFSRRYLQALQKGTFLLQQPEANYPLAAGIDAASDTCVLQNFAGVSQVVVAHRNTVIVNSSASRKLTLQFRRAGAYRIQVCDCQGRQVAVKTGRFIAPLTFAQAKGGYTAITAVEES